MLQLYCILILPKNHHTVLLYYIHNLLSETAIGGIEMEEKQELGIVKKDGIYFHDASLFAKEHLYFIHWGAQYECNSNYHYIREYLDAFILFHILEGELYFHYRNQEFTASAGSTVILDCKYPNTYWANNKVIFQWFHFSGSATQAFCDNFFAENILYFDTYYEPKIQPNLQILLSHISGKDKNDFYISTLIHTILCHLASDKKSITSTPSALMTQDVIIFMKKHLIDSITVDDMASYVGLSLYHFTRTFKKVIGVPPHDFLLNLRIAKSKEHLSNTADSIDVTASLCGFSSTSHFIRAFKKATGFTPKQFRQIF